MNKLIKAAGIACLTLVAGCKGPGDTPKEEAKESEAKSEAEAERLRAEGADAVVVAIHQGLAPDKQPDVFGCAAISGPLREILDRLDAVLVDGAPRPDDGDPEVRHVAVEQRVDDADRLVGSPGVEHDLEVGHLVGAAPAVALGAHRRHQVGEVGVVEAVDLLGATQDL